MKFGVSFPQSESGSDVGFLKEFAQAAEELGYAFISAPEHVVQAGMPAGTDFAKYYSIDASFHEIMTLLAYWSALTERIELVSSVLVLPQRQAVVAAKQAAQIDLMSGGRLRLGVGLGWNEAEFNALGMTFADRGSRLPEQIEVMQTLWTERLVTYRGQAHAIENMGFNPSSLQKPIPVWIGALKDPAIRRTARIADGWFMYPRMEPDNAAQASIAVFKQAAGEHGRDPGALGINATVFAGMGNGAEDWLASAERWRDLGATEITFRTGESGFGALSEHLEAIRSFARSMPAD